MSSSTTNTTDGYTPIAPNPNASTPTFYQPVAGGRKGDAHQLLTSSGLTWDQREERRAMKKAKMRENRSTVTMSTDTATKVKVNVFDAVLGESEDLLQAAFEAQSLGRLKMAAAYQLLLHARLVGLGKRFDRAKVIPDDTQVVAEDSHEAAAVVVADTVVSEADVAVTSSGKEGTDAKDADGGDKKEKDVVVANDDTKANPTPTEPSAPSDSKEPVVTAATATTSAPEAPYTAMTKRAAPITSNVSELTKLLPSNIELDTAMVEHLARAAMELHHQRTGRVIQSDVQQQEERELHQKAQAEHQISLVWSRAEKHICHQLHEQGMSAPEISKHLNGKKTDIQIKAFLQNQAQLNVQSKAMEEEFSATTPTRKKGRGRKPPTQAVNTVPNANLNARKLLSGQGLQPRYANDRK